MEIKIVDQLMPLIGQVIKEYEQLHSLTTIG